MSFLLTFLVFQSLGIKTYRTAIHHCDIDGFSLEFNLACSSILLIDNHLASSFVSASSHHFPCHCSLLWCNGDDFSSYFFHLYANMIVSLISVRIDCSMCFSHNLILGCCCLHTSHQDFCVNAHYFHSDLLYQ